MTCCAEPLFLLGGGAALVSAVMGFISTDLKMFVTGLLAVVGFVAGYIYYSKSKIEK